MPAQEKQQIWDLVLFIVSSRGSWDVTYLLSFAFLSQTLSRELLS